MGLQGPVGPVGPAGPQGTPGVSRTTFAIDNRLTTFPGPGLTTLRCKMVPSTARHKKIEAMVWLRSGENMPGARLFHTEDFSLRKPRRSQNRLFCDGK
jgi:hypothetical protein